MKGDKIPDNDHISRLCQPKHVHDGQIQATAFQLRKEEESLSVNWLEVLNCSSREIEIDEIRKTLSAKLRIGARAEIAVLNVGETCKKVLMESEDNRNLEVFHAPVFTPEIFDPSHSGIYNLKHSDEFISELILETVIETYPARQ